MKKILLNFVFLIIVTFLLIIILIYIDVINDRSPYSHLNKFEKELVNKIEKYSIESIETQKDSTIYFSQLTDKKFQRVETVGCYEIDWNKKVKLPPNLEEKVNKKIGFPENLFITIF
ncbi:MAG: hypothetical protein PHV68_06785, partial [Candidatus Gastranaerophilales bacterium]|nr:hypothetical protein [Candidatus Gastranaerophilales bacterium]